MFKLFGGPHRAETTAAEGTDFSTVKTEPAAAAEKTEAGPAQAVNNVKAEEPPAIKAEQKTATDPAVNAEEIAREIIAAERKRQKAFDALSRVYPAHAATIAKFRFSDIGIEDALIALADAAEAAAREERSKIEEDAKAVPDFAAASELTGGVNAGKTEADRIVELIEQKAKEV